MRKNKDDKYERQKNGRGDGMDYFVIRENLRPSMADRTPDKVQLPNGHINDEYYMLHYPDWINVIAETTDGQIIL